MLADDGLAFLSMVAPRLPEKLRAVLERSAIDIRNGSCAAAVYLGRQVLVAKGGTVEGDVMAREAIIGGEVRGSIHAEERVEIQTASVVHGDIATRRLLVHEGGEINGVIRMGEGAADTKRGSRPAALGAASTSAPF